MKALTLSGLDRHRDLGLLLLRLGMGLMFVGHGVPKIMGGPKEWVEIGSAMGQLGIHSGWKVLGLMAGLAEAGGGVLIALGLFTRLACLPPLFTVLVALNLDYHKGRGFLGISHAAEAAIFFVALFVMGGGRYSVDAMISGKRAG